MQEAGSDETFGSNKNLIIVASGHCIYDINKFLWISVNFFLNNCVWVINLSSLLLFLFFRRKVLIEEAFNTAESLK